jgi:NAD(P)H-hydrate repair Nnr-like enzyme with NAD(P)H-hydrate epimerase domain
LTRRCSTARATTEDLATAFAANLVAINRAEQALRDVIDAIFGDGDPEEPKSELAKAIDRQRRSRSGSRRSFPERPRARRRHWDSWR